MWLDLNFWSSYFKVFSRQITVFCESVVNRVFPTFDQIDKEAEKIEEEEYERIGSLPGDENSDMADAAEKAQEAGLEHYMLMSGVKQALISVTIAGLYHLFEQQLLLFHRKQVLDQSNENKSKLMNLCELKKRLADAGINIESLSSWPKIDELRHVTNAIKHAEGVSADKLRSVRPDLFVHPTLRNGSPLGENIHYPIYMPLGGEDIYPEINDFQEYGKAITDFWDEFGKSISVSK